MDDCPRRGVPSSFALDVKDDGSIDLVRLNDDGSKTAIEAPPAVYLAVSVSEYLALSFGHEGPEKAIRLVVPRAVFERIRTEATDIIAPSTHDNAFMLAGVWFCYDRTGDLPGDWFNGSADVLHGFRA